MAAVWAELERLLRTDVALYLGLASLVVSVFGLLSVPRLICALPEDFLLHPLRRTRWSERIPEALRPVFRILKNLFGYTLLLAGLAMLVLPGQGVFTVLLSLILIDFPGKKRAIRYLMTRPRISRAIDRVRRRRGVPPLRHPDDEPAR